MEIFFKFESEAEREKYLRALAGNRVAKEAALDDLQMLLEEEIQDSLEIRYHRAMYRNSRTQRKSRLTEETLNRLGLTRGPDDDNFGLKGKK